jgi:hypothetical protein
MAPFRIAAALVILGMMAGSAAGAELPDAIAANGETVVLQVHAEGAQIYECKAAQGNSGLSWQFREPIASLFRDGKPVGRHYAGPTWEIDGSAIVGKAVGRAPGATGKDIPWLKLEITDRRGNGPLDGVTTVQRINTAGGGLEGACDKVGDLRPEPYAADYVFLKKSSQ